jgi:hypothetical protein
VVVSFPKNVVVRPQLLRYLIRIDDRLTCSCFEQRSTLESLSLIMKEIREVGEQLPANPLAMFSIQPCCIRGPRLRGE